MFNFKRGGGSKVNNAFLCVSNTVDHKKYRV